ncbi:protein phosphatase 2C domain-containing protein [Legionella maceachernii]|uniref:Phosphocholine hydrolase Lem3 n=2 Tax=Legionella TaxID=445 RepID=A0A0W0VTI8_9GAMM|nr:protein phosphatase 2C domain-containing protein [Legionella maceachernii]KTD23504.1 Phosphocholine hydrolase Lem3 [Legionella maceachernii]SJZ70174.1 hypothetical protein SAMN02745128_00837 [Legionella maceachernii]SUP02263.1 Uncharacterised protein [Legionella maceachernii]
MGKHDVRDQQKVLLARTKNRPFSYEYSFREFLQERFNFFGNTQSLIVSGSTYSNATSENTYGVLDASVTDYLYDEHGVRIGLTMATADGLDHSADKQENLSTALVSSSACESFVNKSKQLTTFDTDTVQQLMLEAGEESKKSKLSPTYNSKSSLAATVIYRQPNGAMKAIIGNVGDGMIVVIDGKTGDIKQVVAARDYQRHQMGGFSQYIPNSVQDLTEDNVAVAAEFIELDTIKEDDIIIQMTDGIWGEFECTKEQHEVDGQTYRAHQLTSKALFYFDKLIRELETIVQLGENLLTGLSLLACTKRNKFQELIQALQPFSETLLKKSFLSRVDYEAYTISVWLEEIRQSGDSGPGIADDLQRYLQESQEDIHYNINTCPAKLLAQDLQRKGLGDCATIAIMQVPNHKKELVRALISNPQHRSALLARIEKEVSEKELDDIITSLSQEKSLPPLTSDENGNSIGCASTDLATRSSLTYPPQTWCLLVQSMDYVRKLIAESPSLEKPVLLRELTTKLTSTDTNELNVAQLSMIFDICSAKENLFNTHRNPNWDQFFGIKNTRTWGDTVKEIRDFALTKLFKEADLIEDIQEKIALLEWAKKQPLFNQHRSNFVITGAWGNTAAVSKINGILDEIETVNYPQLN